MSKNSNRVSWEEADQIAKKIHELAVVEKIPRHFYEIAGSYRRKRPDVGDIDLCIRSRDYGKWAFALTALASTGKDVLVKKKDGTVSGVMYQGTRVEFYVAEDDGFGAMLCFCTGSWELNVKQRQLAISKGMKLNEKGVWLPSCQAVFDEELEKERIEFQGKFYMVQGYADEGDKKDAWVKIAGKTERDVYEAIGMEWLDPEIREV